MAGFYQVWDFIGIYVIYQEKNKCLPSLEIENFSPQVLVFSSCKKITNFWEIFGNFKFPRKNKLGMARFYQVWDFIGILVIYQEKHTCLPSQGIGDFFLCKLNVHTPNFM